MQTKSSAKKLIGSGAKMVLVAVVLAFLGLHSFNFFQFTFPADQWYYAFLGFGLTSGGVIGYLLIFMWEADTTLRKTVAVVMLVISVVGELLTAGFGMQVESLTKAGYVITEEDFKFMILAIQILGLAHGLALLLYYAGDQIFALFRDDDGDGIPNMIDPVDNRLSRGNHRPSLRPAMAHTVRTPLPDDDEADFHRPRQ